MRQTDLPSLTAASSDWSGKGHKNGACVRAVSWPALCAHCDAPVRSARKDAEDKAEAERDAMVRSAAARRLSSARSAF